MKLLIFLLDGALGGRGMVIPDRTRVVRIGRDPWFCHVPVPSDDEVVAAVHCVLRNTADGPWLRLREKPVWVNGVVAFDGQRLGRTSWLQLGEGGPRLLVRAVRDGLGRAAQLEDPVTPEPGLTIAA